VDLVSPMVSELDASPKLLVPEPCSLDVESVKDIEGRKFYASTS
jgi:hypothetical protein